MAVSFLVAMCLPGPAHARPETDEVSVILLHPRVSTILQLPDKIEEARLLDHHEFRFSIFDGALHIRPRPGTPAGTEALLVVESRTMRRTFWVRVVRRARDANRNVMPLPPEPQPRIELVTPLVPPVVPAPPSVAPPAPEPAPALAEPVPAPDVEPTTELAAAAAHAQRFELSVQGVAGLGTTALDVPGYAPTNARQSHRALGMRFTGSRSGSWWAVEGNISGEWPVAPTEHSSGDVRLDMSGPWLRADGGLRGRFGTTLMPTFYVGGGLQAHHRDTETSTDDRSGGTRGMPFAGVLTLGMGLAYRTGDMLLGLEVHVRQGVPTDYRSVGWFLSVGFFLDQGE